MPTADVFTELTIRIYGARADSRYPVEISVPGRQPPAGCVDAPPAGLPSSDPTDDSQRLAAWLFADANLKAAWAELRGLYPYRRVRLRIDTDAPELHRLPWELLQEVDMNGQLCLLAGADRTPFSRYLAGGWEPGAPVVEMPVRILVAIANPDFRGSISAPEPVPEEKEWQMLKEATFELEGARLVDLVRLPAPCTLASLETALRDGYHILHFLGHGSFDAEERRAVVYMADANNKVSLVYESDFRDMVSRLLPAGGDGNKTLLRLIFLASCRTATRSDADAFAGFAPQLVRGNVPVVLAMQDKVSMDTARAFTGTFYRQLLHHGLVDLACNQARAHLLTGRFNGAQTPVLFSRLPDNQLLVLPTGDRRPVIDRQPFEPETISVPAGVFCIGRPAGPGVPANQSPPKDVPLASYRIGRYPVTNDQYLYFVRDTGHTVAEETGWELANVGRRPPIGKKNHPVVGVSWDDAVAYCQWLKKATGRSYRLPSEAEWEAAARSPDNRLYPWGADFAMDRCNAAPAGVGATTPVGTYSPHGDSRIGCGDMAGNVWEWTNTLWGQESTPAEYPYPYDPIDGRESSTPRAPYRELRICRGGSFNDPPEWVTCTVRARYAANIRGRRHGFRVAMDV
jgi:formylglycine-generating enzyme required for sulfatase activity